MIVSLILLSVAVIAFLTFTFLWSREKPLRAFMLKGIATVTVIATGTYTAITFAPSTIAILIIIGLVLCMLGDLVLALLELCNAEMRTAIISLGTLSFALAQIIFIVMLALLDLNTLYGLIAGVVIAGVIYLIKKPMGLDFGKSLVPSLIYACLLGSNVVGSIILCVLSSFALPYILLALGFIFFIASDLILSKIYFGGVTNPTVQKINYFAYYIAICLLSVCFIAL